MISASDCGQNRLSCCECDLSFFDWLQAAFWDVLFGLVDRSNSCWLTVVSSPWTVFAESSIGCRIRRRALMNQLLTCNSVRLVSAAMARFSSSVG